MNINENIYNTSKIYKLISSQTQDIYIGSTTQKYLCNRKANHKYHYNKWLEGKHHYISSFELLKYDDCQIVLIEKYNCNTNDELNAREQYWIEKLNCINRHRAKKDKNYDKEWFKKRNEKNKEKMICECGCKIAKSYYYQHIKTKKHKERIF